MCDPLPGDDLPESRGPSRGPRCGCKDDGGLRKSHKQLLIGIFRGPLFRGPLIIRLYEHSSLKDLGATEKVEKIAAYLIWECARHGLPI